MLLGIGATVGSDVPVGLAAPWVALWNEMYRAEASGDWTKLSGIGAGAGQCSVIAIRRILTDAAANGVDPLKQVQTEPAIAILCGTALQVWYNRFTGTDNPLPSSAPDEHIVVNVNTAQDQWDAFCRAHPNDCKPRTDPPVDTASKPGISTNTILLIGGAIVLTMLLMRKK